MDTQTRQQLRLLLDAVARERLAEATGRSVSHLAESDARRRRELAKVQGWNDAAPFLNSAPEGGHYSADVWAQRSRSRDVAHGVAVLPTERDFSREERCELYERLANGEVAPTVRIRRRGQFASEIVPLSHFAPERESRRTAGTAATAAAPDTARTEVQPQLRHDFTS